MNLGKLITRPALAVGAVAGGAALGAATGSVAAAAYFARRILTPDVLQPDDVRILAFDDQRVTLATSPDTVGRGHYGVWLDGGAGHARVGPITDLEPTTVTRELVAVDSGALCTGPARWNQYYYSDRPSISLGIPDEDVIIVSDVGALPAWLVRPEVPGSDWAILVHGRGAQRQEALRAVPVLRAAGFTSLIAAYRNDRDAPPAPDGRYNLGLSEWHDVEAAMAYAVEHGAERIVLVGWSMGGAIALQVLDNSPFAELVAGVVLDSAVIDWGAVLRHQAHLRRMPSALVWAATRLMGDPRARRLVGVREPLDVARTDWVTRSNELHHRLLLIHSDGDDLVPIGPAAALAAKRPDLVRFERWETARHCRGWKVVNLSGWW